MKVTSTETVDFPMIGWGITKGEERELPADKDAQAVILAHPSIAEAGKAKAPEAKHAADKDRKPQSKP